MDEAQAFLVLDGASVLLAVLVGAFFLRSHRLWPDQSLGVLGVAFLFYAASHATASLSGFDVVHSPFLDACRTLGVSAAGLLILTAYAFRWRKVAAPTMRLVGAAVASTTIAVVAVYAVWDTAFPLAIFPWLRTFDALVLVAAAGLSTMGVRAQRLSDLRVPLAYVCLALSRYSAALYAFLGHLQPSLPNYAWRLAGLLGLALFAVTRWPRAPP